MCTVSMAGDFYIDKWKDNRWFPKPSQPTVPGGLYPVVTISREEFDTLKKEVSDMKELLKRAVKYDQDNNQANCHIDEKIELLKKIAEMVGISLEDVLTSKKT